MGAQTLVLVGGGRIHSLVLRLIHHAQPEGLRVVLVTDAPNHFYSRLAPLHIAGGCSASSLQINVRRLARQAGIQVIIDRAVGIDLENRRLLTRYRSPVPFDLVSLGVGCQPCLDVPGSADYAVPVASVISLLANWNRFIYDFQNSRQPLGDVVLVGGGATLVELAMCMATRLDRIAAREPDLAGRRPRIRLVCRNFLPSAGEGLSKCLEQHLAACGILVHRGEEVVSVNPASVGCRSGLSLPYGVLFWDTGAMAEPWLGSSGLATDEGGFLLVDETLRTVSHPNVFAAGSVARIAQTNCRGQAQALYENLILSAQGKSLREYHPLLSGLGAISLLETGRQTAFGAWGPLWWGPSSWIWRVKARLDLGLVKDMRKLQTAHFRDGPERGT